MKKIIALLISVSCLLALVSCGSSDIDTVRSRYLSSKPTKSLVVTTMRIGEDTVLEGEYCLICGSVGGAEASVYEATYEELLYVEDGATQQIVPSIKETTELREYLDGYGVRVNGGKWDAEGENFASDVGSVSLNLKKDYISNYTYKNGKFECVVEAKNTAEVLGIEADLAVNASLEIIDDGASVNSIIIKYTLPADAASERPATEVTIKTAYFYDVQKIVINVK